GLDFSKFKPENASDRILTGKQSENALYGDVGIGFYLLGNEHYSVGIGLNNLISHRSSKITYRPSRTVVVHGSYTVSFPSLPKVEFTPSTYLETDFHVVNWMINITGTFNKRFWAGLGYRLRDAVCINAGINIGKLQIGAAYDITASNMIRASKIGGSFEVMVRYCFGLEGEKVNTDYKNARYL
ncbi:MAG: type IX secretion system membrane protein PorP/SprF, partial [Bacteroidales bacterium]|nr:type IX secretion system membrane protein PorP/SprF [Bacteroidales bacterium]